MPANPWLPYKREHVPARLRLVCLPYAGGGASAYRPWIDALPGVEVLPVQPPGREGRFREPAFDRLPPLVSAIADAIAPIREPFALFGHSLGALTAFELAREFRRRGAPMPSMLIVSGRSAAHLPPRFPPLHALPDAEFVAALKQFNGTPAAVLDNAELMQAYLPLLRADFAAHETYRYSDEPSIDLPIAAFTGDNDARVTAAELSAWSQQTTGLYRASVLPGDHFYLTTNREALLAELRGWCGWRASQVYPSGRQLRSGESLDEFEAATLAPDEVERANRFVRERDRIAFVRGRCYLREVMADHLGIDPLDVEFRVGRAGKPELDAATAWRFNVSHSHEQILVTAAVGREVGIDIEFVRDDLNWRELAERYFAPAEVADIAALPTDQQRFGFYRVWTRKEAYLKALGLGLTVPLDGFRVSVGEPARLLATDHDLAQSGRWSLESLEVPPGYVGALCVEDASTKRR